MVSNDLRKLRQTRLPLVVIIKIGEAQADTVVMLALGTEHLAGQDADVLPKCFLVDVGAICVFRQSEPAKETAFRLGEVILALQPREAIKLCCE